MAEPGARGLICSNCYPSRQPMETKRKEEREPFGPGQGLRAQGWGLNSRHSLLPSPRPGHPPVRASGQHDKEKGLTQMPSTGPSGSAELGSDHVGIIPHSWFLQQDEMGEQRTSALPCPKSAGGTSGRLWSCQR